MLYKRFMVYFTTFYQSLKYLEYCKDGGGGYVVKTYPSIDPHSAPPPRIIKHT